jgi:iron-sulfur cluster assembly accessory protein
MAIREDIKTNEGTEKQISLTERAASELKTLLEQENKPNAALRVWVAGGGCSGLQYGMALDDSAAESDDVVLDDQGIKIYVDSLSLKYMTGSIVDFVDDTFGGGFKIENPKAVKSCGCGSSFSAEDEGLPGLDTSAGGGCGGCGCR